jgi:hypothetical protein
MVMGGGEALKGLKLQSSNSLDRLISSDCGWNERGWRKVLNLPAIS